MNAEPEDIEVAETRLAIQAAIQSGNLPTDRNLWAEAYAKQSRSDFAVYELLTQAVALNQIEQCHSLHYLQMACEKIAKAYRFRDTDTPIENLLTSHVAFSKIIVGLLRSPEILKRYHKKDAMLRQSIHFARRLGREIELLAPAVERDKSPQNAEYPWAGTGKIIAPCEYGFPNVSSLVTPEGQNFIKIVKTAIVEFDKIIMS